MHWSLLSGLCSFIFLHVPVIQCPHSFSHSWVLGLFKEGWCLLAGASMHKGYMPQVHAFSGAGHFFTQVLRLYNKMLNSEESDEGLMFIGFIIIIP